MNCSAYNFYTSTVYPTVIDFKENSSDIRKARLAAIVLCHMIDHWALKDINSKNRKELDKLVLDFKDKICREIEDYKFIIDVADASKHAKLALPKNKERLIYNSECVTGTPGLFNAPFGEGFFLEACTIYATLDDGSQKEILQPCITIINYWQSVFKNHEVF